ncbi:hypothetical protein K7X08_028305 [Anisodus acutangulus]|uniref:Uncharacterized protein n=1 Tax=Anisodus acutangulus TaxID=402998 RepID=A0A9Q1M9Z9_9SOLA|nr:hypothetical protein K7X08_028305 [Anisodus acutangulus]
MIPRFTHYINNVNFFIYITANFKYPLAHLVFSQGQKLKGYINYEVHCACFSHVGDDDDFKLCHEQEPNRE